MSVAFQYEASSEVGQSNTRENEIQAYIQRGIHTVDGWGIDAFLAGFFLTLDKYHQAEQITGNLLEIGVHHGRSAILIALMAKAGERPVFIDLFDRQSENIDHSGRGDRAIFESNLEAWAPDRTSEIVQANTMKLRFSSVAGLSEGLRFAHIDGGHHRSVVLNDIRKTEAVLTDGGIVVIDDFFHSGFPEVNEACNFYLQKRFGRKLAPVALGHNKLVLTTRSHQRKLVAFLQKMSVGGTFPLGDTITFHGYPVLSLDRH